MHTKPAAGVHVCALRHIPEVVARTGARHLISAINADLIPATPSELAPERHLRLDMHDIIEERDGAMAPAEEHVHRLVSFAQSWDGESPLLIHCFAGLSRSTAAAFITLCALNPDAPEHKIAVAIRRASDTAIPNRRFVALADDVLGRRGRMVSALTDMGPNRFATECIPFRIDGFSAPRASLSTDRAA
ncbi:MAG TPA: protein tyrosine phosphatase [Hyphomicrobium sp.]|nr:protein tyrosine phosphatase [Hyphomicrobium sp.]